MLKLLLQSTCSQNDGSGWLIDSTRKMRASARPPSLSSFVRVTVLLLWLFLGRYYTLIHLSNAIASAIWQDISHQCIVFPPITPNPSRHHPIIPYHHRRQTPYHSDSLFSLYLPC